jgi:hypothetical protein
MAWVMVLSTYVGLGLIPGWQAPLPKASHQVQVGQVALE